MARSRIDEIRIKNFKFFSEQDPIKIEGKHLLLYGENGSGKSSLYWALYTLLECANKDDIAQIQKYFDPTHDEKLINIHAINPDDAYIEVTFQDGTPPFKVSYSDTSINQNTIAQESNWASDFITYRNLLSLYSFAHSEPINLIWFFEYAIFPYVKITPIAYGAKTLNTLNEAWAILKNGIQKISDVKTGKQKYPGTTNPTYINYANLLRFFIERVQLLLTDIVTRGNSILKNKLGYSFQFNLTFSSSLTIPKPEIGQIALTIPEYEKMNNVVNRPHSFLNEAKLSALGLAMRLAVLEKTLTVDSGLNLLVLDDLLISLDMSNRDKVLDLILSDYKEQYQILFLTHDKFLFQYFKHKIKNYGGASDWCYLEMYETNKNGRPLPYITKAYSFLEKAELYFYQKDYEASGNFLRKEAEAFCKDFLPKKYQFNMDYSPCDLNGLILHCKCFAEGAGLNSKLFDDLDGYRKFVLNPSSHDSYDIPKFNNEIKNCIETLKQLRKINNKSLCNRGEQIEFELTAADNVTNYRFEIRLEDDFRLLKEEGKDSIISCGMVNYWVTKNEVKGDLQHGNESLKKMYEKCYKKSNNAKSPDFWNELIISSTGSKLNYLRVF